MLAQNSENNEAWIQTLGTPDLVFRELARGELSQPALGLRIQSPRMSAYGWRTWRRRLRKTKQATKQLALCTQHRVSRSMEQVHTLRTRHQTGAFFEGIFLYETV